MQRKNIKQCDAKMAATHEGDREYSQWSHGAWSSLLGQFKTSRETVLFLGRCLHGALFLRRSWCPHDLKISGQYRRLAHLDIAQKGQTAKAAIRMIQTVDFMWSPLSVRRTTFAMPGSLLLTPVRCLPAHPPASDRGVAKRCREPFQNRSCTPTSRPSPARHS